MGPIVICDKSFIEMLSIDESVWLDKFFCNNIVPILYMETLADLAKSDDRKRGSTEKLVSEIAEKTPTNDAYPNVFHGTLVGMDLTSTFNFKDKVKMDRRPVIWAGVPKRTPDDQVGLHITGFPELDALKKWCALDFSAVEKIMAPLWRVDLKEHYFERELDIVKNMLDGRRLQDLSDVKSFVDDLVKKSGKNCFYVQLEILNFDPYERSNLFKVYEQDGMPSLDEFAPYAAYVFKVKLFLYVSICCGLISKESTYLQDILYLFYLPFCQVFVSNDKSHARMVPLFLEEGQKFVRGKDLKDALGEIDTYYAPQQDIINKKGVMQFNFPPDDLDNEVTKLWDEFCPNWRQNAKYKASSDDDQAIQERISTIKEKAKVDPFYSGDPSCYDFSLIKRTIYSRKGKWLWVKLQA